MNARLDTIQRIERRSFSESKGSAPFENRVFHRGLIQKLPKKIGRNWLDVLEGKTKFDPTHADAIAEAIKQWAIQSGCTHFRDGFSPLNQGEEPLRLGKLQGKDLLAVWDPTFFPFLWEEEAGLVLYLPKGAALPDKVALLRSEEALNQAVLRLLHLCGISAERVYPQLEMTQEYFLIDRELFLLRPDLLLTGRTVFGAQLSEKQDFAQTSGRGKERIRAYLREVENVASALGISVQTRPHKGTPAQYEIEFLLERSSLAADRNRIGMELLQQIAFKHDLACLLDANPFKGIQGSAKQMKWSLGTDTGLHLLDPKENDLIFATLQAAISRALHEERLIQEESPKGEACFLPFRGNQVEFQTTAQCSLAISTLQAVIADSLQLLLDEITAGDRPLSKDALPLLRKALKEAVPAPTHQSFSPFAHWIDKKTIRVFEGILSEEELHHLYERKIEHYVKTLNDEVNMMIELFETQILPAAQKDKVHRGGLESLIDQAIRLAEEVKKRQSQTFDLGWEAKGKVFCELIVPKMAEWRKKVDELELKVDNALWPLPKYGELLFLI